jgi:hypothetical protein
MLKGLDGSLDPFPLHRRRTPLLDAPMARATRPASTVLEGGSVIHGVHLAEDNARWRVHSDGAITGVQSTLRRVVDVASWTPRRYDAGWL